MGQVIIPKGIAQAIEREWSPVRVSNPDGDGPCIIVCDHASNHIPPAFGTLGLPASELEQHIAWDPGALGVSRTLSRLLDAPLVESCVSRLIVDCNRPLDAPDLVPSLSETTVIPANADLSEEARRQRVALSHRPYHAAIDRLVLERGKARRPGPVFIAVHSYTPVYRGVVRPWHIGIIHDADERIAAPLIAGLRGLNRYVVGVNEPYSPADRVYYTLQRHAGAHGMAAVMIEIRNDLIAAPQQEEAWGALLADFLKPITEDEKTGTANRETARGSL
ncbi:MAG: N-formylglutamate amidohydrolase [Phyllobacterium sp.]